ncbi:Uncharacterized protein HZ326_7772 [Fusarium oxysporum f. sp. albedinis]|nr:Uncharacterized protein HZ326_7772 [Fusarium oxysporum f. sp. albedinis]
MLFGDSSIGLLAGQVNAHGCRTWAGAYSKAGLAGVDHWVIHDVARQGFITHVPKLSSTGSKSGPDSRRWRQLTWIVDIGEAFTSKVDYLPRCPDCSTWLMDALAGLAHPGLVPAMPPPCRILRTPRTPFDFPDCYVGYCACLRSNSGFGN